jgi:threonine aldolase
MTAPDPSPPDRTATGLPAPPRCAFASDNAAGAHPKVIEWVEQANHGHALAYGDDSVTRACERRFAELFDRPVTTHLAFNGTGANVLALGAALAALPGGTHGVVCSQWAHIAVDETGAPERVLGTKLLTVDAADAKVTPDHLRAMGHVRGVQHHVQPGVVSLTQATELGTVYTADEIGAVVDTAHAMGMLVHVDGARIANAAAALGGDLRSFTTDAGVDVVSFGGTKNGLLGAEAVVFLNPDVARGSAFLRKQVTQLPSKMRFLAAQFNAVLDDGLWLALARHANAMATELHAATSTIDGVVLDGPPAVNSLFPTLPADAVETLRAWCFFWDWDTPEPGATHRQVRWMTSWDTTVDDVRTFADGVAKVLASCN